MRVLDLGSGAGDNALVASELVGPTGEVVGIDRSAQAVARATERARARGLSNVAFRVQDIQDPWAGQELFDAVIGRLVLMYAGRLVWSGLRPAPSNVRRHRVGCAEPSRLAGTHTHVVIKVL